jgi:hypothetical protein
MTIHQVELALASDRRRNAIQNARQLDIVSLGTGAAWAEGNASQARQYREKILSLGGIKPMQPDRMAKLRAAADRLSARTVSAGRRGGAAARPAKAGTPTPQA